MRLLQNFHNFSVILSHPFWAGEICGHILYQVWGEAETWDITATTPTIWSRWLSASLTIKDALFALKLTLADVLSLSSSHKYSRHTTCPVSLTLSWMTIQNLKPIWTNVTRLIWLQMTWLWMHCWSQWPSILMWLNSQNYCWLSFSCFGLSCRWIILLS